MNTTNSTAALRIAPIARFFALFVIAACTLIAAAPSARAHGEIIVGQRSTGQLIVLLEGNPPIHVEPSIFPGIEGFATAFIGFESTAHDHPEDDVFELNPGAMIQAILTATDDDVQILDGGVPLPIGGTMTLGGLPFDYHPITNIVHGHHGDVFTLTFVFRDLSGMHPDSEPFVLAVTPEDDCPADLDGDGAVSASDLAQLLGAWGMPGPADFDDDGAVTASDLAALLGSWGPCP